MLEPVFVRDMEKNYFILKREEDGPIGFQQKMLFHNSIDGLLRVEIRNINNEQQYYYDVTALKSVKAYYEHNKLQAADIEFIYKNIMNSILNSKKYLLSEDCFVISQETIFFDDEKEEIKLCYKEDYHINIREQLVSITEYFMDKIDYNDERVILYIYGVYKVLREENCTFQDIEEVFHKYNQLDSSRDRSVTVLDVPFPDVKDVKKAQVPEKDGNGQAVSMPLKNSLPKKAMMVLLGLAVLDIIILWGVFKYVGLKNSVTDQLDFKKAGVCILIIAAVDYAVIRYVKQDDEEFFLEDGLEDETKTVVLGSQDLVYRLQSGELANDIIFSESDLPFVLGKSQELGNGRISNSVISKQHCIISMELERLTIADLDSTNGTYLNGVKLESHKVYGLELNDTISLGNIEFLFRRGV